MPQRRDRSEQGKSSLPASRYPKLIGQTVKLLHKGVAAAVLIVSQVWIRECRPRARGNLGRSNIHGRKVGPGSERDL